MTKQQLKYIVISDLHLGEKDSLFTSGKKEDFRLLEIFSECLAQLQQSFDSDELPILVLNGDILGLSFSSYQESLTGFQQLLSALTITHRVCQKIAYIPGNHDHQIWQQATEDAYRAALINRKINDPIPKIRHSSSPNFDEGNKSDFFDAFTQNIKDFDTDIKLLYPNMVIKPNENGDPYVIIHHGHYAESTYHFISNSLKALYPRNQLPQTVEALEADNGAWINFAFSELGRSGHAGKTFERLMNTLSSEKLLHKEVNLLASNVASALDYPFIPFHWAETFLSKQLIFNIASKIRSERYQDETVCSEAAMNGLTNYLDQYCVGTLEDEGWVGEATTLIWSHTHKPFNRTICTSAFDQLKVMNTGGWVVPDGIKKTHGGSIILINQNNEVQELRIWNDGENGGEMVFEINKDEHQDLSLFARHINDHIKNENNPSSPWKKLKIVLKEEIKNRRNYNT